MMSENSSGSVPDANRLSETTDSIPAAGTRRAELPPPAIPDHELLRLIGWGSYGEVWLARNALGSYRAVKVVYRKSFDHDRPYEREFEGLKKFEPISHARESQVDIFHVGRNDEAGFFYYIMELADDANVGQASSLPVQRASLPDEQNAKLEASPPAGRMAALLSNPDSYLPHTLKHELRTRGALPVAECVQIALSLTRALAHLHGHGLVHRDIKPSNIIFVNGVPKLADIGLVTSVDATRSFVGTDGYIPPEGPGTPQADLYSFGKVLYECVTGKDRLDFPELPADWRTRPDFEQLLEFNEILTKACDADPSQRYADAESIRVELELVEGGESVKRKRAFGRRWKLVKSIVLMTVALSLAGGGAIFALHERNRNRPLSSDPEAVTLYSRAKDYINRGTLEGGLEAYANLAEAVKRDPRFLDAYYLMFELYFAGPGDRLPPRTNEQANLQWVTDKLRTLSRKSAQYHTAAAWLEATHWEFDKVIEHLELALKADPKFMRAHCLYAATKVRIFGDAEGGLREFKTAERLGPWDYIVQLYLGTPYYLKRDYTNAIEHYQRALRVEPRLAAHFFLGRAYEANRQYDLALNQYELGERAATTNQAQIEGRYQRWRSALAVSGPDGMWEAMLNDRRSQLDDSYEMARLYARLGNSNEAIVLLNKAFAERDGPLVDLLLDDCWDTIRQDPRFQELVKRMGLKPKR